MCNIVKGDVKIIMPEQQKNIRSICERLWRDNFDDTDSYIEYYFNNRWKNSITVLYDDKSMLHLNPYECMINGIKTKLYYIVGVCTDIKYRKMGLMDACIRSAFDYMYKEKKPFTYLMPASEEIYIPYGFTGIYPVESFIGNVLQLKDICNDNENIDIEAAVFTDYRVLLYQELLHNENMRSIKQSFCEYANRKLSEDFSCYVTRDENYFDELYKEVLASNGGIATFWYGKDTGGETVDSSKECIGYVVYFNEDKIEISECVLEPFARGYAADFLYSLQYDKVDNVDKIYSKEVTLCETSYWGLTKSDGKMATKNFLMARIIDIKTFVQNLCADEMQEIFVEVEDRFISGNNGRWHIIIDKSGGFIEKFEDNNRHLIKKYTIDEFGRKYLNNYKYFLNESV